MAGGDTPPPPGRRVYAPPAAPRQRGGGRPKVRGDPPPQPPGPPPSPPPPPLGRALLSLLPPPTSPPNPRHGGEPPPPRARGGGRVHTACMAGRYAESSGQPSSAPLAACEPRDRPSNQIKSNLLPCSPTSPHPPPPHTPPPASEPTPWAGSGATTLIRRSPRAPSPSRGDRAREQGLGVDPGARCDGGPPRLLRGSPERLARPPEWAWHSSH